MASELTRENENIRFACCGITRLRCANGNITALTLLRYTSKAGYRSSPATRHGSVHWNDSLRRPWFTSAGVLRPQE